MKVKATKKGFDGTAIREEGDVFDMPDTTEIPVKDEKGNPVFKDGKPVTKEVPVTGSWFEPVEAQPKKGGKGKDEKDSKDEKSLA